MTRLALHRDSGPPSRRCAPPGKPARLPSFRAAVGDRVRLAFLALYLLAAPAMAQDGAALFEPCRACHALEADAEEGAGPNLSGVIGRKVAGDPRFDYSPALRAAREAGLVWDRARLERFLADPEAMFPGLWMGGNGVREEAQRRALVTFLAGGAGAAP